MNSNIKLPVTAFVIVNGVIMFTNAGAEALRVHDGAEVVMAPHSPDTVEDALTAAIQEPIVSQITTGGSIEHYGVSPLQWLR